MVRDVKMKLLNEDKRASGALHFLVILFATILALTISGFTMIETISPITSSTSDLGKRTQERITTDIEVLQISVCDTTDSSISPNSDNISVLVRVSDMGSSINLDDLFLKLDTRSGTQMLDYSGGSGFNNHDFGINYKIKGYKFKDDYIGGGDLAEITFTYNSSSSIREGEKATLKLLTKNGALIPVYFTIPSSMMHKVSYLYP